jgi:hypothetical protein
MDPNKLINLDGIMVKLSELYDMKNIIVKGDLILSYCGLTKLPDLKEVGGDFYCDRNKLTTLEGSPTKVGEDCDCSHNQLTSLKGGPKKVGGWFDCNHNQLKTLEGAPTKIGWDIYCGNNPGNFTEEDVENRNKPKDKSPVKKEKSKKPNTFIEWLKS